MKSTWEPWPRMRLASLVVTVGEERKLGNHESGPADWAPRWSTHATCLPVGSRSFMAASSSRLGRICPTYWHSAQWRMAHRSPLQRGLTRNARLRVLAFLWTKRFMPHFGGRSLSLSQVTTDPQELRELAEGKTRDDGFEFCSRVPSRFARSREHGDLVVVRRDAARPARGRRAF